MSAQELTDGCHRIRRGFNTFRAIGHRATDRRTNSRDPYRLGLFLASNLVSKWMIDKKQGLPLGEQIEHGSNGLDGSERIKKLQKNP